MAFINYRHKQKKKQNTASFSTLTTKLVTNDPPSLTTLISRSVLLDIDVFLAPLWAGAAAQDPRPVYSVMVAELLVPCYVHAAVVYFPQ